MSETLTSGMDRDGSTTVSVVATVYNSGATLSRFVQEVVSAIVDPQNSIVLSDIILVNDGSTDDSLAVMRRLREQNDSIRIVNLSRNFGHHAAITAGLDASESDLVFLIDSDLEEDPLWFRQFLPIMMETGADVVFGVQERRRGSGGRMQKFAGHLMWWYLQRTVEFPIAPDQLTCRLMTRRFVNAAVSATDRVVMLGALWAWVGFRQVPHAVQKRAVAPRRGSTYSFRRRVRLAVDAVSATSAAPLFWIFAGGAAVSLTSVVVAAATVIWRVRNGFLEGTGFASILLSVWFLGGAALSSIGVVGLYLSRIFEQVRRRPMYVVANEE